MARKSQGRRRKPRTNPQTLAQDMLRHQRSPGNSLLLDHATTPPNSYFRIGDNPLGSTNFRIALCTSTEIARTRWL